MLKCRLWAVVSGILFVPPAVMVAYAGMRAFGWGNLLDVAVSPDGTRAAAASAGGVVVFLAPADGGWTQVHSAVSGSPVISCLFSHDGMRVYTIHEDGVLRIWDPADGTLIASMEVFESRAGPGGLALNPGGELVAVGSLRLGVRVITIGPGQVASRTDRKITGIALAFVSQDELAVGVEDGNVYLWRLGDEPRKIYSHRELVSKIVYHPMGYLISVSDDKTAVVYNLRTREITSTFRLPNFIRALALHPGESWALLGSYREAVVWDFLGDRVLARTTVEGWVSDIAWHPSRGKALLVTWEGEVMEWDPVSGELFRVPKPKFGEVTAVLPDCSLFVTKDKGRIRVFRLPTLELLGEVLFESWVDDATWLPERNVLVSLQQGKIHLWDMDTLELSHAFDVSILGNRLYPSLDGARLVVQGWHEVLVCNVDTGACTRMPLPRNGHCRELAVSPDGRQVAVLFDPSGDWQNRELLVWNTDSGELASRPGADFDKVFFWAGNIVLVGTNLVRILDHTGSSNDLPLSSNIYPAVCCLRSDGVLACGNFRGVVTMVDLKRPTSPYTMTLCGTGIRSLFICDRLLVLSAEDGTVIVHDLPEEFIGKELGP